MFFAGCVRAWKNALENELLHVWMRHGSTFATPAALAAFFRLGKWRGGTFERVEMVGALVTDADSEGFPILWWKGGRVPLVNFSQVGVVDPVLEAPIKDFHLGSLMEPVSIQMDEDKRPKMGSLQHTPSFHRCLEATVALFSAWKSFRSRTQLTDCFFSQIYTQPIFWLQRWQCEWSKCLFVAISSFLWNSTSSPGVNLLPGADKSGYCWWEKIRLSPVEVGILSHYLQGFLHPRWCRISSIKQQHQQPMKVRPTKKTLWVVAEVIHSYRSSMLQGSIGGWWGSLLKLKLFFLSLFPEDDCCTVVPEKKNIIYNICYGQAVYERNLAPPVLFKHRNQKVSIFSIFSTFFYMAMIKWAVRW